MRKRHLLAIICALFLAAAVIYYIAAVDVAEHPSAEREYRPSFVGTGLNVRVLDSQGRLEMAARADRMEHYRVSATTVYDRPRLWSRLEGGDRDSWEISAERGYFNSGEFFSLDGSVAGEGTGAGPGGRTGSWHLATSYLQLDLNSHDISSDREVVITGDGGTWNRGTGLRGNLDSKKFSLRSDCHAVIDPEVFDRGGRVCPGPGGDGSCPGPAGGSQGEDLH